MREQALLQFFVRLATATAVLFQGTDPRDALSLYRHVPYTSLHHNLERITVWRDPNQKLRISVAVILFLPAREPSPCSPQTAQQRLCFGLALPPVSRAPSRQTSDRVYRWGFPEDSHIIEQSYTIVALYSLYAWAPSQE